MTAKTIWVLVNERGEYLQVDLNASTGQVRRWWATQRAWTPCFERACDAWRYAGQFVPGEFQPVHPVPEQL